LIGNDTFAKAGAGPPHPSRASFSHGFRMPAS
jgi:hypothetical protein